ncbi:MAG: NAD(P)-dependent oxidoreductase [Candidatus Paceibacterota bacterium]
MKKIGFLEVKEKEKELLKVYPDFLKSVDLFSEKLTSENVESFKDYEILSCFIYSDFNAENLSKLKNLKLIVTRSRGTDHIDLEYCQKNNIIVKNIADYGSFSVAEFTFGLLLCLIRKIYQAYHQIREDTNFNLKNLEGEELFQKTLGVIGTGAIGKRVIQIAKGFQMNVVAYDKFPDREFSKKIGFSYVNFEELLKISDIISFHVPLTEETYHLLNKNNIHLIKKGAYLINTSRGGIIETEALYWALKNNILKGAALDVLEGEEEIKEEQELLLKEISDAEKNKILLFNHALIDMENVLITPHIAFYTFQALKRIIEETIFHIQEFLKSY